MMEVDSSHTEMTPLSMKSRNCLIDDIKCMESQLSALQERFDVIVNWIRSQYFELNGLPHFVIVAVRGDRGFDKEKLESTREKFPLASIEHVKVECENFDGSSDVHPGCKIESDDQSESSVDKMDVDVLKGIEFGTVPSKLSDAAVGSRQLFEAEEDDMNWRNEDKSDHTYSDCNGSESSSDERPTQSNKLKASRGGTRMVVKKTPQHFRVNRAKGLILTALEYQEMIASLPIERLSCAICNKEFPTTARIRRHEIEVHLTKEEAEKCRSDILKCRNDKLKASKASKDNPKKNVQKTSQHLQVNREKGLILTASEYQEIIATLPKERLTCAICNKEYPTSTTLRRHEVGVHLMKEEAQKLRSGRLKISEGVTEKCATKTRAEKRMILTAFEYKELIAPLPKERLCCAICEKECSTTSSLRRHEIEVHLTKEEGQKFRSSISHINKTESDVAIMCDICNIPFRHIEAHKKNHPPPGVITTVEGNHRPHYRCLKCDSLFSEKKKYLSHVTTECKVDETAEKSNSDQNTDELRVEKNFLCNQCGQIFNRKYTLQVHELAVHANKRDFKCQFCDKRFVIEYRKKMHEKKHLGTSSVTCDLCGFSFRGKQILRKHIRGVHENKRPYKCPFCDKSFKTSTARNYHINTHGNPNGRQRSLNRDVDPIWAAKKRRHRMVVNLTSP